ncbi:PREDICTED: uncharacterized protein LOC104731998 isoform X1 [Camelina sativa]|uniref:Uncharacterized protein LOC104731998 isoform X1 n=1 Tax=Camelina sativa TaxID=90675 RepID=A0ABM0V2I2_CAMSA|nr:PREDICTED: uncharacterized protein LOC104731998 isoform X1 [Camelina sativa]XP_010449830.1 PREDICTED: uncharacterized protein LOC104731998 isoform X1 [Camelina sativa]
MSPLFRMNFCPPPLEKVDNNGKIRSGAAGDVDNVVHPVDNLQMPSFADNADSGHDLPSVDQRQNPSSAQGLSPVDQSHNERSELDSRNVMPSVDQPSVDQRQNPSSAQGLSPVDQSHNERSELDSRNVMPSVDQPSVDQRQNPSSAQGLSPVDQSHNERSELDSRNVMPSVDQVPEEPSQVIDASLLPHRLFATNRYPARGRNKLILKARVSDGYCQSFGWYCGV